MKPQHRILFDCERMKYPHTGLYHFCLQLGTALLRNRNASEEDISFYVPPSAEKIFGEGSQYILQNSLHKFVFPSLKGFDIWHVTVQASNYSPKQRSVKKVVTIHDLNFLYEHSDRPGKIKRLLRKIQDQVNSMDKVCTISAFTKSELTRHLDIDEKKIEVIHNGCNINFIKELSSPAYLPQRPFIFSIGTIMPKKNFHVLPSLLRNNDMELVIAGVFAQPAYVEKIKKEAIKHGVADRLVFTGPVSENDKQWYLKNCTAFVFPSIAEGFGLPVIEAMAFGKPVFLSTATSLPEIGGNIAYYFLSFDVDEMQRTIEKGMLHYNTCNPAEAIRAHARQFSWDNAAKLYLEVYRELY